MSLSSPEFLLFIGLLVLIYFWLPSVWARKWTLILASLLFLVWTGVFNLIVFLPMVLVSWFCVRLAAQGKRWAISAGVALLVLNFIYWKYLPSHFRFGLPLGLSFSTLQAIAYLVEYRQGRAELMSFSDYLLFRGFFAQLIAGPIVRARELLPQIKSLRKIILEDLVSGILLFTLGFSKKLFIADRVSLFVNPVFQSPANYSAGYRILAAISYAVQIWADFSGYTDMARGAAKLFGIDLPENFRTPYFSASMTEYWSRWHITFTAWVKEFLFFPLALSFGRINQKLVVLALLTTTVISGLWHGWLPTFALWGLFHGVALCGEYGLGKFERLRFLKVFAYILTFTTVCVGLIIFRSPDLRVLHQYLFLHSEVPSRVDNLAVIVSPGIFACVLLHIFDFSKAGEFLFAKTESASASSKVAAGLIAGACALAVFIGVAYFHPHHLGDAFIYFQF